MSDAIPARPHLSNTRANIAIVASLYNEEFVEGLLKSAVAEIETLAPQAQITTYRVPGAFEVPVCTEFVLKNTDVDVVLCLGLIIRGKTEHGDLIGASVTNALQEMAVRYVTPVIHEVLLVENAEQARERCLGDRLNRGVEAARVAINMVQLFEKLQASFPQASSKD